jgi:hypothetical protein
MAAGMNSRLVALFGRLVGIGNFLYGNAGSG